MMEGNLPIQWVVDFDANSILRGVRMPTETLKPVVNGAGQFERPLQAAYEQWDLTAGKVIAEFPIWQLMMVRIRPDNYRSEEHTSELQSLMRNSYAVFCLKQIKTTLTKHQ